MTSMAVSRLILVKDMESLVRQGMTYEISERLRIKHPASKRLSSMGVFRFCKKNNLGRNCKLNKEELMKEVFQCTSEVHFDTVILCLKRLILCIENLQILSSCK